MIFQESVVLSNPGSLVAAVPLELAHHLGSYTAQTVDQPQLPGERVAEAVHDLSKLSLCDCGPPRVPSHAHPTDSHLVLRGVAGVAIAIIEMMCPQVLLESIPTS